MELLLSIVAFFLLRYIVTNKHSELKGKVNGVIFVPLFSLLLCYVLYKSSDEFVNQTLSNIDNLRYTSTYSPYLGEDIHTISRFAIDNGYMSDEIVPRSSEIETAFGYGVLVKILSAIAFICCVVWIINIGKLLFEYKNNEKFIKISTLTTWGALFLGAIFHFLGLSNFLNFLSEGSGNAMWLPLLIYTPIALALIYWHCYSYKELCSFISHTEKSDNTSSSII